MMPYIIAFITAVIPTMAVFLVQRKIKQRDDIREIKADEARAERKQADKERLECEYMLLESINASIALGSATAIAVKRGHANGEVKQALAYAEEVKRKQRNFYQRQGVEHVHACNL